MSDSRTIKGISIIGELSIPSVHDEMWKDIDGYQGRYRVSNKGGVHNTTTDKILKSAAPSADYNRIVLCKDGISKSFALHRLVAFYFVDNPDNKPIVHHIDENKWNNVHTNLEWVTHKENSQYHYDYIRKRISQFKVGVMAKVIGTNHMSRIISTDGQLISLESPAPGDEYQDYYFEKLTIV